MAKRVNTRRRRIIWTLGGSLAFVAVAIGYLLLSRPAPEPYVPGQEIEGITDALGRELPADIPSVTFTDVTAQAGIDFRHFDGQRSTQLPEDMGSGTAWGDYDDDGDLDLYVVNFAGALTHSEDELASSPASSRLYRNEGDGSFEDVTAELGLEQREFGMAAAWADYDGDGDLDLATSSFGRHRLMRNDGEAGFNEVSEEAGLLGKEAFWAGLSWADFDRDGDLDLYVCGYVDYQYDPEDVTRSSMQYGADTPGTLNPSSYSPLPNLLYRNLGDGTFEEVAEAVGVHNPEGRSLSGAWGDFDDDGWPDLYVANDVSDNVMFHNTGLDIFANVSHPAWVADYRGAMGLASGDWDNDRDLDLFVTHWIAQENALYENLVGAAPRGAEPGAEARPALRFNDRADMHGLGEIALDYVGWGTSFLDYDLDGRLDLLVVNGSTLQGRADPRELVPMADQLFWNAGERGFFDVSSASAPALAQARVSRGAAVADYDNDGDPDVFIVDFGNGPRLLRNDGSGSHWLKLRLSAAGANSTAIGARVEIEAGGLSQVREIGTGSSYLSQDATEALFGLGDATGADLVSIRWPDGSWQELGPIEADQALFVEQGKTWAAEGSFSVDSAAGAALGDDVPPVAPESEAEEAPELSREETLAFWDHYRTAVAAMKRGDEWQDAAEGFRAALALNPLHGESMYDLGNCLIEMGDYPGALEQYTRLTEIDTQSQRAFLQIGRARSAPEAGEAFDLAAAEAAFAKAVALNPEESGALLELAMVQVARGRLDAAAERFDQLRIFNPRSIHAAYFDGYIQWQRGDKQAAAERFAEAVELVVVAAPTSPASEEGDTNLPGDKAMLVAGGKQRTLFGARIEAVEAWQGAPPDEARADAEYAGLAEELAALIP